METSKSLFKSAEGQRIILSLYDKTLSKWPVAYSEHTIDTTYGKTSYIDCGNQKKPSLILLHGASSNATSWIADVKAYSHDFRIIIPDVIGEPGKSAPTRPSLETDDYAKWLDEIISKLHLTNVSLIGLSQGGWIATKYAVSYPEKVRKLVLLTSAGITPTKGSFLFTAILFTLLGKWGIKRLNQYVFGKQPMDKATSEYMNAIMENFTPRFTKEYIFSDTELKKLVMPVLYLGGTDDVIRDNNKNKARLESLLPNLKTKILSGSGHVLINTADKILPYLL